MPLSKRGGGPIGYWRRLCGLAAVVVVVGGGGACWCVVRDSVHPKGFSYLSGFSSKSFSYLSGFSSKKVFVSLGHYYLDPTGFCIFPPKLLHRPRSARAPLPSLLLYLLLSPSRSPLSAT